VRKKQHYKVISTTYENKEVNTVDHLQIQYPDFQVYFNNIRLTVPSDCSPVALTGLIKILQTL